MSKAFDSIMAGLRDALAYARGEPNDCTVRHVRLHTVGLFEQLTPEQQKMALETAWYVPEAESEQHPPPKRESVGSNPTGDSNSDNL